VVIDEHESKSMEVVGMRVEVFGTVPMHMGAIAISSLSALNSAFFHRFDESSHNSVKVLPSAETERFLGHNGVKGLKRQQKDMQSNPKRSK
jgi:hypothetical protein